MQSILPILARHLLVGSAFLTAALIGLAGQNYYATPSGAGAQDGTSWADAWPQTQIQTATNNLQPGDILHLGSGTYTITSWVINGSGTAGNPKTILGVDTGGGRPVFQGNFDIANDASGARFMYFPGAAHHWVFRNLAFRNQPWTIAMALVSSGDDTLRSHIIFDTLSFDTIEDGIRLYNANNIQVINCTAIRYTKKAFRAGDHTSFLSFRASSADCTGGDPSFRAKAIPVGFGGDDTDGLPIIHDIEFIDCTSSNNGYPQGSSNYWNGDGFSTERGTYNVSFIRCVAIGNNDGGFDNKATNIVYRDSVAIANSRGFRHWAGGGQMINCLAAFNEKLGGTGGDYGIWVSGNGGELNVDYSTLHGSGTAVILDSGGSLTMNNSILSSHTATTTLASGAVSLGNSVAWSPSIGTDPAYVASNPAWRGVPTDAMDSQTYGLTKGYNSTRTDYTPNTPPLLAITASTTGGIIPVTVAFTAEASDLDGTLAGYAWDFGDGQSSSLQNPSITYYSPGSYTVTCTVTDNRGAKTVQTVSVTTTMPSTPVPLRIESGSSAAYTDGAGNVWAADFGFTGGGLADRGVIEIAGTTDDRLYQTERWGVTAYSLLVANGTYQVRLHLAETFSGVTAAGQRLFSVTAEGTSPAGWTNIDIFAEAGDRNVALVKTGIVTVTDNYLNLAFSASVNNTLINAVELLPYTGPADMPPAPPAGLAFSGATPSSFVLNWAPATDDIGVVGYDVFRDGVFVGSTAGLSLEITGLAPYTTYGMSVRSRDTAGNGSALSAPFPARTLDDGTTGAEIIVDNASVFGVVTTGAWVASTSTPTYYGTNYIHDNNEDKGTKSVRFIPDFPVAATYSVYVRWPAGANRANNTPIDVTHVSGTTSRTFNQRVSDGVWVLHGTYAFAAGTTGSVLMRTTSTNGFVMADAVRFVREAADVAAPTAPAGLAAASIGSNAFTLTWTAATDNVGVAGYNVFRDGVQIGTATGTSLPVTGLAPYTNYQMTVQARDAAGNVSALSAPLVVRTLDSDNGTGGAEIILDNTSPVGVTITGDWISATTTGGYYGSNYIQDGNVDKGTKSIRYTPDIPVAASYTVYVRWTAGSNRANNVPVDVIHADGTTTQLFNQRVSGGAWVSHGVYAFAAGTSNSILLRTTDTNGFVIADAVRLVRVAAGSDTTAPSVPAGLSAGNVTNEAFTLSWTASTDNVGVTGYEVFLDGASRGTVTGTSTSLTSLTAATSYSATVRARDAAGNWSAVSSPLSVTTAGAPVDTVPPTAPTGLTSGSIGATSFSLTWTVSTDNVDVTGYEVFRDAVSVGTTASTNFNVTGLAASTTYAMTVRARDAAGNWSPVSGALSVTTTAAPGGGPAGNGRVISLNLSDGTTNSLALEETAGAVPVANWNNSAGNNTAVPNAIDDHGTVTTADITFTNANFGYTNSTTGTSADARMMRSQRGLSNGSTMTASTAQVPYALYDVYVYWGGRATGESVPATMTINLQKWNGTGWATAETKFIRDGNRTWDGTFNESTAVISTDAVDGNEYVVFRGLTDTTFRISATLASRSGISGFQIVEQIPTQTGSAPTITSETNATGEYGKPFNYGITATQSPTGFTATGLPAGLVVNTATGVISGVPTVAGAFDVALSATNTVGAGAAMLTLTIERAAQVITFNEPESKTYGDGPFELEATSNSSLPVAYAIVSGPGTLLDNVLTITGAGTIVVSASQAGDVNHRPAEVVELSIDVAQAEQTISLDAPEEKTFGDAPFAVSATASSGLPVTLAIESGLATLSGGVVTIHGAGLVVLTATQAGNDNFLPAETVEVSIAISRAEQALVFPAPGAKTYGDAPFMLAGVASSGLPVAYTLVSGPASITDGLVTLHGAGIVVVAAEQPGDANYFAADPVIRSFEVAKAAQAVVFPNPGAKTFGDAPFALTATASSGLPVSYTVSGPATLSGNMVTLTGAGAVTLTAVQPGDSNHFAAEPVTIIVTVAKAAQTIVFPNPGAKTFGDAPFAVAATASSGLPVSYTVSGPATLSGNMVTLTGAGTVTLTATQPGDDNYLAAETITITVTVAKAAQTITFPNPGAKTFGDASFALAATTTSGLPASYAVTGGPATVSGSTVTLTGAGTLTLVATQTGDANYLAAEPVTITVAVAKAAQAITFPHPGAKTFGAAPFALAATASSGLPVGYAVTSGPATVSGSTVTLTGAGTVTLVASQPGNTDYLAAEPVSLSLQVAQAVATITLDGLWQVYDGTPKTVTTITTPAGLAVAITYAGSATPPTYPGSYAVTVTSNDANYMVSASGTLVIAAGITVRHAPVLNGNVEGSVQVLLAESVVLNSSASVTGDLLMPGSPSVRLNGQPVFSGVLEGSGAAGVATHQVTLNSGARLRNLVRRVDAGTLPAVSSPVATAGTRSVSLNNAGQDPGDFATIRNLTLNSNAGIRSVPPGAYDTFTANGSAGFILGVPGATEPAIYSFQSLVLNGNSQVQVVGPVLLLLANTLSLNGDLGAADEPERLFLCVANGGVTLNGGTELHAIVQAPNGTVTVNGNALLSGSVAADRLTVNGNGAVRGPEQD